LSTGILCHFGADTGGPPARLTTLQPCPHGRRLQVWLPACWLRFGWVGLAPSGRLIRVSVYIPTSSPTGIAWSLPRQRTLEPALEPGVTLSSPQPRPNASNHAFCWASEKGGSCQIIRTREGFFLSFGSYLQRTVLLSCPLEQSLKTSAWPY
jgi:hypothetical protein